MAVINDVLDALVVSLGALGLTSVAGESFAVALEYAPDSRFDEGPLILVAPRPSTYRIAGKCSLSKEIGAGVWLIERNAEAAAIRANLAHAETIVDALCPARLGDTTMICTACEIAEPYLHDALNDAKAYVTFLDLTFTRG